MKKLDKGTTAINRNLLIILILGFVAFSFDLTASRPYQPKIVDPLTEPWRWKHFPELEGKGIRHVVESFDQKVWVSSNEGVLEYDGYNWKTHNAENGLYASPVEQLLVADDSAIYATAANGIFRYQGEQWEHFFKVPDNRTFIFHHIEQLKDRSIIACADWGFVHFLENGERLFYTSPPKIEQLKSDFPEISWIELPTYFLSEVEDFHYASDVLEAADGTVWFALTTEPEVGKLLRFKWQDVTNEQINKFEVIATRKDLDLGEDQKLLQAKDGRIWVINSTSDKGVNIFDGKKWETIFMNRLFGGDEYLANIVQSENGIIWLSSIAKIMAYKNGKWERYHAPTYPVPANRVILHNSQTDQLWVSGYKSKVLRLDFSTNEWLTYENLSFQCQLAPDEQWFLERNNRIIHRKGDRWTSLGTEDGLMDAPIRITPTSKGQIWVVGSHQGKAATAVFENGKWERHIHPKLSWGIDYRAVLEAKNGSMWFGGAVDAERSDGFLSGVLQLIDPTAECLEWVHHVFGENGLDQANNYGIGQSKDGRIWIGGSNLLFYDGKSWNNLPDERLQQYVNYVCSTDDLLLVGSRFYGVFVFDGKKWENYTTADGLSGNTIISIDALSDSIFIVATENSICKFDGSSWTNDIFPEKLNMGFEGGTIFHTDHHIWINHVPRGWKRRAYQSISEQELASAFFTTRYHPSHTPPETNFDFYPEEVSPKGNSLISWGGKDFFGKTAAENLVYSYRMDGGEWSVFNNKSQHTFTSMRSGDHILEVRARDLDFNVDPSPAMIEFKVKPPIWKQAWFIAFILTFLLIYSIYEYRVITKKRKLEILNNSLSSANEKLNERGRKIEAQNREILAQQEQILKQSKILESNNLDLEARNEEIRQQRDKLEEMIVQVENLSKAKLGFFTNISHELRTPLTLITGPISQLKNEGEKLSKEKRHQFYNIIERNAGRLLKLINQLLEMRRIEHSTLELKLHNIHLAGYISDLLELFNGLAFHRDVQLQFSDRSKDQFASLDPDKVEKIMVNLLSNAFKHTPEGGRIKVTLKTVSGEKIGLDTYHDSYFEITVKDTGHGISKENIDLIFDKYFTSDSEVMDTFNTGIGLSYTYDLVYLMEGELRVESQLGKGTKFTVYLPLITEKGTALKTEEFAKPALKIAEQEASFLLHTFSEEEALLATKKPTIGTAKLAHILVVEDNPDMRHFLESILSPKYRVTTKEDGSAGLKAACSQTFDLIISDVMMPEMDGISLCSKLRENLATSHIPIILLTAKVLEESKLSGYLEGADDYITKPFNPELLLVRVENLLQQRQTLRDAFNKEFMFTPKIEKLPSPDEEFLKKLVTLMNENLGEAEFNIKSMCHSMHLSHMHFIRKVKQLTGKKPIDLLKSFRMKKAKNLLAQQKLTIAEVAYKVGFDLPNSFSRAFKKEFNMTPTQFIDSMTHQDYNNTEDTIEELFSNN